jgi:DNA-binding transcriptional LysR family regulator
MVVCMELRHLRYFVAVAEECHFGRAAARLYVTQSTLSAQIQGLEHEVGGPLFIRTSRRVELTDTGTALLIEARRAIAQADRALSVARQAATGDVGSVRIGFSAVAVLQGVLTEDLCRFHRAHPGVELHLTELPPAAQARGVHDGSLDVGYGPEIGLDTAYDLVVTRRAATSLAIAIRRDHELAALDTVTTAHLAGHDLIFYGSDDHDQAVLARLHHGPDDHRARIRPVNGVLSALALAAAGTGVAIGSPAMERITMPELTYRLLHDTAEGMRIVTLSRPGETSGPVRALLSLSARPDPSCS